MAPAIAVQKGDANSVLAPAPEHPDFLDLCIAITGRVPLARPFLDAERRARLVPLSPQGQEIGGQQGVAIAATHAALDPQELRVESTSPAFKAATSATRSPAR